MIRINKLTRPDSKGVHLHASGHLVVWIRGRMLYANRIAWSLGHNRLVLPHQQVHYLDGNQQNLKLENLVLVEGGKRVDPGDLPPSPPEPSSPDAEEASRVENLMRYGADIPKPEPDWL
jgi:hypothetical protein